MQIITLKGHEYKMAYNMRTAIAFERMTGTNPLQLANFAGGEVEAIISVAYCMLLSNNDPINVPEFEDFLASIDDVKTMTEIVTATSTEMQAFFQPKKGDPQPAKPKKGKKKEEKAEEKDDSKNG